VGLWDVVPDSQRKQWALEPFATVGPLQFGMNPGEASAALGGIGPSPRWHDSHFNTVGATYGQVGVTLYYASGTSLCGVTADARRGPQVLGDGKPLVGQVPSELEQWLVSRAEDRAPYTELVYMPGAELESLSLGVVVCLQRAGDRLLTRPVFLDADAKDDTYHRLPPEAWRITA
jgi:hypothetical protein